MYAPFEPESSVAPPVATPMSAFAYQPPSHTRRFSPAGIIGVASIHVLLVVGYVFAGPVFHKPVPQTLTVSMSTEPEKDIPEPPPPPEFEPPPLPFAPVPVMPEIVLTTPPPPSETAIAIPPAPPNVVNNPQPARAAGPSIRPDMRIAFGRKVQDHLERSKRNFTVRRGGPGGRARGGRGGHGRGDMAVVVLSFAVDRQGHALNCKVVESSGSDELDEEAVAIVMRAQPLPSLPIEFGDQLEFSLPLEINMR